MASQMDILITGWALDSYLELVHGQWLMRSDYRQVVRPDVLLLRSYPDAPKFRLDKFWSPATLKGVVLANGFKMKWHNLGERRIQLRLTVAMFGSALLLQAYVKTGAKAEARQMAKFKTRLELIRRGRFVKCGKLS